MKYSSMTLQDLPSEYPLKFSVKVIVEYRPDGVLADSAPIAYHNDPEAYADEIVRTKGWDKLPSYTPAAVWVDVGL